MNKPMHFSRSWSRRLRNDLQMRILLADAYSMLASAVAMATTSVLTGLRSVRDLRAAVVQLALAAREASGRHTLQVRDSRISAERVRHEWHAALAVLDPALAGRLRLSLLNSQQDGATKMTTATSALIWPLAARRPLRYELLRLLLEAHLSGSDALPGRQLQALLDVSENPVRRAAQALEQAGLIRVGRDGRELIAEPWDLVPEVLARLDAQPEVLRLRFRAGSNPFSPEALFQRFVDVSDTDLGGDWTLAGFGAARAITPELDLSGHPRVDLVARLATDADLYDGRWLRQIASNLEPEPNPLESVPLTVTVVRTPTALASEDRSRRQASAADIVLSLLALGLSRPARQFVDQWRAR